MQTQEIHKIAKSIPIPGFIGVFAADALPSHSVVTRCCFICNTDPASEPGTHWLAFNFIDPLRYEFFDSYGQSLSTAYSAIIQSSPMLSRATCIAENTKALQSLNSNLCGQYCLYFLYHRVCRRASYKTICSRHFSSSPKSNDSLVNTFSCNVLKYCFGRDQCTRNQTQCTQSCRFFSQCKSIYC